MKKLMIAVAAAAIGIAAEAATAQWSTGTCYLSGEGVALSKSKDSSGAGYTKLGAESMVYLFAGLNQTDWEKFTTTESIWSKFDATTGKLTISENAMDATESKAFNTGKAKMAYKPSISEGDYNYAVVVVTHTSGDKIDYYAANAIAVEGGELDNVGYDFFAQNWGYAGAGDSSVWVANSVPEPTSGLLLLLGVAGLALRRRRA